MARTKFLQDRTRAEREEDIKFFVGKSVNDLRRRLQIAQNEMKQVGRLMDAAKSAKNWPRHGQLGKSFRTVELKFGDLMIALDSLEQAKKGGPLGAAGLPVEHFITGHLDRLMPDGVTPKDITIADLHKNPISEAEKIVMTTIARENIAAQKDEMIRRSGGVPFEPGVEALGPVVSLPVARELHNRLIKLQSTLVGHDALFEVVPTPYAVMKDATFKALVECFDMVEKVGIVERKGIRSHKGKRR
jgi:hypothetical protein